MFRSFPNSISTATNKQVADIGTLQRLPRIVGDQRAAELTLTARTFNGAEAQRMGLVLEVFDTEAEMMAHVKKVAADIALKSPITARCVLTLLVIIP